MGFTRGWRAVVLVMLGLVASQATGHGVAASDYAQALKEAETGRADTELLQIFRMGYEDIKDGGDSVEITNRKINLAAILLNAANTENDPAVWTPMYEEAQRLMEEVLETDALNDSARSNAEAARNSLATRSGISSGGKGDSQDEEGDQNGDEPDDGEQGSVSSARWQQAAQMADKAFFRGDITEAAKKSCHAAMLHRMSRGRSQAYKTAFKCLERLTLAASNGGWTALTDAWAPCKQAGLPAVNNFEGPSTLAEESVALAAQDEKSDPVQIASAWVSTADLHRRGPAGMIHIPGMEKYVTLASQTLETAGLPLHDYSCAESPAGTKMTEQRKARLTALRSAIFEIQNNLADVAYQKRETDQNRREKIKWLRAQAAMVCPPPRGVGQDNNGCQNLAALIAVLGEQLDEARPVALESEDQSYLAMVQREFDAFVPFYDASRVAVGAMNGVYAHAKDMVQEAFALYKPRRVAFALDVGVGTGLVGEMVRKHMEPSGQLVGVDLSAMMLKRAQSKRIYTETHQAEALVWLRDSFVPSGRRADLITAIELFLYFGAVERVFDGIRASLARGGLFVASFESLEDVSARGGAVTAEDHERGYVIRPSGRWAHTMAYLAAAADKAGLELVASRQDVVLRQEFGVPEKGHLILCRRGHGPPKASDKAAADREASVESESRVEKAPVKHESSSHASAYQGAGSGDGRRARADAVGKEGGLLHESVDAPPSAAPPSCACSLYSSAFSDADTVAACEAAGDGTGCRWHAGSLFGGVCRGTCIPARGTHPKSAQSPAEQPQPLPRHSERSAVVREDDCATGDECAQSAKDLFKKHGAGGKRSEDQDRVVALFARAVALQPDKAAVHNDFGVALASYSRWALAVEHFGVALQQREAEQQRRVARGMTPSASLAKKVRKVKRNLDMALEEKARADAEL